MPPDPPEELSSKWQTDYRFFVKLWIVVTVLWTVATLLRVDRVWRLTEEWAAIVRGPWLWLELALPPIVFGGVTIAVGYIARARTMPRSMLNRR